MKHNFFKLTFFIAGMALLMTSCDPDLIDPIDEGDPVVSVTGVPSGDIDAGSEFTVTVNATPDAANQLKTVDVTENNSLVDFSRLTINGTPATANPILLFGDDKNGLNWNITIVAQSGASTSEYSVNVIDEGNNQSNFSFDVTTSVIEPVLIVTSSANIQVAPNSVLAFMTEFEKGTFDLESFAIYQNGELISDFERMAYRDLSNTFDGNPYLLPDGDIEKATVTIYLRVQDAPSSDPYQFVVFDTEGNSSAFDFNVITITPVTEITGVLFNSAGPVGTGGLDLDDGVGTGSSSELAEIKDEGIDTDLPVASNWKRSISAVNGSVIKQLKPGENGLSETFSYDDVDAKETVVSIFESGEAFTLTNSGGNLISASVNPGDMFTVNNGDNFYLLIVREVNTTEADNGDNYVIDIKQ